MFQPDIPIIIEGSDSKFGTAPQRMYPDLYLNCFLKIPEATTYRTYRLASSDEYVLKSGDVE